MFGGLRKKLEEVTAQVNPWDGGKTASTVRAARQQAPPVQATRNQQSMDWKIKNAKYGVLANNPKAQNRFTDSVKPTRFNPITAAADSYADANDRIVKTIGKGFWETGDTAKQLPGALVGRNNGFKESADQSIVGGVSRFGQSVASTVMSPLSDFHAVREQRRANRLLTPAYENLYRAYGADPRLGKNQAQVEAGQTKYDLMTDPLQRSNVGVNDSLATTTRKVAAQGAEAGLDILTAPAMALATKQGIKAAIKAPTTSLVKPTAKSAALSGSGNAMYAMQQDGVTPGQVAGQFAAGAAIGTALPVTTNLVGQAIRPALKKASLAPPSKLSVSELADLSRFRQTMNTGALMDEGVYQRGVLAARNAGIDYRNPDAIDDLLGSSRHYETQVQNRKQKVQEVQDKVVKPVYADEGKLPSRLESPLRASMSDDEFFQRYKPTLENPSRPSASDATSTPKTPQQVDTQKAQVKSTPSPNNNPVVKKFVQDYAKTLKQIDDGAKGGQKIPDGRGGYIRTSEHSDFYRNFVATNRKKPTKKDWIAEAQDQLDTSRGDPYMVEQYKKLVKDASDPEIQSLVNQTPAKELTPLEQNKTNAKALREEVVGFRNSLTPVKKTGGESNIPVRIMTKDGDTVTATNVNPNIKAKEKRYALDDNGSLIEDKTGAYSIFTDSEDGTVKGFRIGKDYFDAKDLGDLSDVNGYGSTLATMRRNIERSFGKKTSKRVNEFLVDHQQAQATKMIERQVALRGEMQKLADDLGISFGVGRGKAKKISAAIQNFGEKKINQAELVSEFGADTAGKIMGADKWFREQYNSLLDEMNQTLTTFGYDPVPKRKDYYTHFQEPKLWESFGLKMQEIRNQAGVTMQDATPEMGRGKISNKLAGESEFTTPNKRFNPFAQRREGVKATPDAFQAFERYLTPTLNNIYMTPSITRARVLAKAVAIDSDLAGADANKTLVQVKEWANNLAGKSNRLGDRQLADTMHGRTYLKAAQWVQKKAGQNTIVGNLSTAVIQPIVVSQTAGKFGFKNTILATLQEMSTAHKKDAAIRESSFMKRRYADLMPITSSKTDRARNAANTPLKVVEETAARITWNAAHNDALSKGVTGKKAIQYADVEAEKTLSGRSIGEKPEAFTSKAAGPFTMYQLEVNNFWQQFGKEMTKKQAAKTMIAAYGLNLLIQEVTGRQVGFNPIDAAIDSYEEVNKDKSNLDKLKGVGQRFAGEIVDNTPFVAPLANATIGDKNLRKILGPSSNAGRFGVSSPLSTVISNPEYLVLPFGGSQLNKTVGGVKAHLEGELNDKNDKTTVQIPQNFENLLKGALFGKNAIPEVNQYYDNIGKKKVDQKVVPNQTEGTAATQGRITDENERKSIKDAAFGSEKGRAYLALTDENQKKEWAKNDPEFRKLYEQEKAFDKAFESRELLPDGISEESAKVLNKTAGLNEKARKEWEKNLSNKLAHEKAKFEKDDLEGKLDDENRKKRELYHAKLDYAINNGVKDPKKVDELFEEPKHKFNLRLAEWEDKRSDPAYKDSPDDFKDQEALVKLGVEKDYSKQAVSIYSMSKKRMQQYIDEKGGVDKKTWDELVALDKAMIKAGILKYSKLDGGSGRGGSGRGGKRASKYDWTKNLFDGADSGSVTKSLRAILEEAMRG